MQGHFSVQPNYSVEVVLWLCCVGVVTIFQATPFHNTFFIILAQVTLELV